MTSHANVVSALYYRVRGAFIKVGLTKLISPQNIGSKNYINYNENTFPKQNLPMNITVKGNLNFDQS